MVLINLTKTELNFVIHQVDNARIDFYGANEEDRIKTHGDKYILWKRVSEKLADARINKEIDKWI